jgi:hypothetical protein
MNTIELISSLRHKKEKVGNGYTESTIVGAFFKADEINQ